MIYIFCLGWSPKFAAAAIWLTIDFRLSIAEDDNYGKTLW
jgi:hypothetical protein